MLVKADANGKFAGAVLVADNNKDQVAEFCDGTEIPVTHGVNGTDEHHKFKEDIIRWDSINKTFYEYVEPEEVKLARELATKKAEKVSILNNNFNDAKYIQEKFVDGALTAEEYAPMRALRETWRTQINQINACTTIEEVNAITVEKWVKASE